MKFETHEAICRLRSLIVPEENFLSTIKKFFSQTEDNLSNLYLAILMEERREIKFYAHSIRGGGEILCLGEISACCQAIEDNAEVYSVLKLESLYTEICNEWELAKKVISKSVAEVVSRQSQSQSLAQRAGSSCS